MDKITKKCPHCGNVVEGKIKRSTTSKVARNVIKKGGMKTALGVAGSVVPGFGNVAGFVAGAAIDAFWGDKINKAVDNAADMIVEDTNYSFACPKCGHTWVHNELEQINYTELDEEYDDAYEGRYLTDDTRDDAITIDDYGWLRCYSATKHYCLYLVNSQPEGELDYRKIIRRVNRDLKINISDWQIKDTTRQKVYEKLLEFIRIKEDYDIIFWHNLITALPHGENADDYKMEVYYSTYVEDLGDTLIGINISGTINVGDFIVLCTDDKYYKAQVVWIEVFKKKLQSSDSGDTIGMGIDIDLRTISGEIDCVYKYDEFYAEDEEEDEANEENENEQTFEELEYLDELRDMLSDGEISPRERRLLDKIRTQLGISEERAAELEASLATPTLTSEEQEYLNEYKEIVADGEISARDQRYLEKLKKANGISDERAKELEAMA